jgi:hypothetical protein
MTDLDNVTFSSAVLEPSNVVLAGLGLPSLFCIVRGSPQRWCNNPKSPESSAHCETTKKRFIR